MVYSFFFVIVYALCAIIEDSYGISSMIGTLAAFTIVFKPLKHEESRDNRSQRRIRGKWDKKISSLVLIFVFLEFFFSYYLRIYQRVIFDRFQIEVGGVVLINSFVVVIELIFVIVYYLVFQKESIFCINVRMLVFLLLMLFPFVLKDLFSAAYTINTEGRALAKIDYLNLAYRALILASLTEELLYRGVIFSELCRYFKPITSAIIQSVIFTLVHSERWLLLFSTGDIAIAINLIAVFAMGVLTAYFRYRTQSLVPGILMHFALNGGIYDVILFVLI